jgi:hypothetical protein
VAVILSALAWKLNEWFTGRAFSPEKNGLEKRLDWAYEQSMSSLTEIEQATDALPLDQQESLFVWLSGRLHRRRLASGSSHSVLDITPVSLGRVIRPLGPDDDLLGEMLEERL